MVTWLYYCVKGLLSASTYAGFCHIVDHSTYPCEDNSQHGFYLRSSLFTSDPFSPLHIWVSCMWSFSGSIFCLFIYGRASLAMEGKSVVPMEITFMDMEDNYGTLRSLWYIHSNPFRFPISSFGLPIFFLRIAERERLQNMLPTNAHQPDRIVTLF